MRWDSVHITHFWKQYVFPRPISSHLRWVSGHEHGFTTWKYLYRANIYAHEMGLSHIFYSLIGIFPWPLTMYMRWDSGHRTRFWKQYVFLQPISPHLRWVLGHRHGFTTWKHIYQDNIFVHEMGFGYKYPNRLCGTTFPDQYLLTQDGIRVMKVPSQKSVPHCHS